MYDIKVSYITQKESLEEAINLSKIAIGEVIANYEVNGIITTVNDRLIREITREVA